jgi:uncharacterized membrane protein
MPGHPFNPSENVVTTTDEQSSRLWAAACYFFPVAVFTVVAQMFGAIPRNKNTLFHAWQCISILVVAMMVLLVLEIVKLYFLINLFCLAWLACLVFLAFKAYTGPGFRLPTIGSFAAARAGL